MGSQADHFTKFHLHKSRHAPINAPHQFHGVGRIPSNTSPPDPWDVTQPSRVWARESRTNCQWSSPSPYALNAVNPYRPDSGERAPYPRALYRESLRRADGQGFSLSRESGAVAVTQQFTCVLVVNIGTSTLRTTATDLVSTTHRRLSTMSNLLRKRRPTTSGAQIGPSSCTTSNYYQIRKFTNLHSEETATNRRDEDYSRYC